MIHTYTIYSAEVDVPDVALNDMLQQLSHIALCKNTVGIVACHYEHVESGVVAALGQALPFPLIGCTTYYKATPVASGLFELTITVLTSDDVRFAQAYVDDSCDADAPGRIQRAYENAFMVYDEKPSLILSFISANRPISGDAYLRQLDELSGGVPTVGVVDSGEDESGANTYIIGNGNAFSNGLALLLIIGDIQARAYVSRPLASGLLSFSATATSAQGACVKEINHQPAALYLKKNGVDIDDTNEMILTSLPFYYREPGSDKYICRLVQSVAEDGTLEFMGEIPEGAPLRIGTVTSEDIQEESVNLIRTAIAENGDAELFLIASCVGRFITLGLDITAEMDHVVRSIPPGKTYMACYVGGEICPVEKDGVLVNRYHNNTLIVLALR